MQENKFQYIDIEIVKKLMQDKQLSRKMLAEKMSVSTVTVKRFLNGADQRHMSCAILVKLANALNTKIREMIHSEHG